MGEFFAEAERAIGQLAQLLQHNNAISLAVEHHINVSGRTADKASRSGYGVTMAVKPVFCDGISLHISHICDKLFA